MLSNQFLPHKATKNLCSSWREKTFNLSYSPHYWWQVWSTYEYKSHSLFLRAATAAWCFQLHLWRIWVQIAYFTRFVCSQRFEHTLLVLQVFLGSKYACLFVLGTACWKEQWFRNLATHPSKSLLSLNLSLLGPFQAIYFKDFLTFSVHAAMNFLLLMHWLLFRVFWFLYLHLWFGCLQVLLLITSENKRQEDTDLINHKQARHHINTSKFSSITKKLAERDGRNPDSCCDLDCTLCRTSIDVVHIDPRSHGRLHTAVHAFAVHQENHVHGVAAGNSCRLLQMQFCDKVRFVFFERFFQMQPHISKKSWSWTLWMHLYYLGDILWIAVSHAGRFGVLRNNHVERVFQYSERSPTKLLARYGRLSAASRKGDKQLKWFFVIHIACLKWYMYCTCVGQVCKELDVQLV